MFGACFCAVAHASVDLNGLIDHVVGDFGAQDFHHGALRGEGCDAFERGLALVHATRSQISDGVVDVLGGAVHRGFKGVRLDGHFTQFVADGAVFADGPTKLLACVGVFDTLCDGVLARANDHPTQLDPANVQDVDGNLEAFAALVEQVFGRHQHVAEEDLPGAGPLDAHLLFLGVHGDAVISLLEDEGAEVVVVVDFGEHDQHVREPAVGDPHLLAIQHVMGAGFIQLGLGFAAVGV